MLDDKIIEFMGGGRTTTSLEETKGVGLVWVIDGDCLYDLPVWEDFVDMFLNHDEVIDVSSKYPDKSGITVRFIKNGQAIDDLNTSEYFGNILLSNPLVLNLADYPYGRYVQSPNAKFDGEKFIITNRNMENLLPWHPSSPRFKEN